MSPTRWLLGVALLCLAGRSVADSSGQTLAEAAKRALLPLVAVGGITAARTPAIMQAGASCVAVSAAVIAVDDPEAAARAILSELES